mgnify:CR=1 FL=1
MVKEETTEVLENKENIQTSLDLSVKEEETSIAESSGKVSVLPAGRKKKKKILVI